MEMTKGVINVFLKVLYLLENIEKNKIDINPKEIILSNAKTLLPPNINELVININISIIVYLENLSVLLKLNSKIKALLIKKNAVKPLNFVNEIIY